MLPLWGELHKKSSGIGSVSFQNVISMVCKLYVYVLVRQQETDLDDCSCYFVCDTEFAEEI